MLGASLDYGTWMRRWAERDQNIQTETYERTDIKNLWGSVQEGEGNKEFIFK
jgi:hypothetical protein